MQIIAGAELRLVFPLSKSDFLFARNYGRSLRAAPFEIM